RSADPAGLARGLVPPGDAGRPGAGRAALPGPELGRTARLRPGGDGARDAAAADRHAATVTRAGTVAGDLRVVHRHGSLGDPGALPGAGVPRAAIHRVPGSC